MSYLYETNTPLADALEAIIGQQPPAFVGAAYNSSELPDDLAEQLQDWCSGNANPYWATGDSILETAEIMVERAIENANIAPQDKSCP